MINIEPYDLGYQKVANLPQQHLHLLKLTEFRELRQT